MTEPRDFKPDREAATHAGRDPEVKPELIQDRGVPGDDTDNVAAGACIQTKPN